MDEQAVSNLHGWAQSKGYPGSVEEFSVLLQSDDGALQSAYSYAQEQGFPGDISAFENLVGRKKKDATESVSDDGLLESLQPEVAVSESVSVQAPPEPIEQLDETPTRVFGEEVAQEQVDAMPVGQSTAVKMPAPPRPVLDLSTGDVEFDKSMEFVDPSLVDRGDENQVARELRAEFKDFGFDFETTGIGDAIKVTARNGETMDVDLDPAWYNFGVDEGAEAKSLRKFLTENKDTSELVDAEGAFKEAEEVYGEYKTEEDELVAEFEDLSAKMKALPKDDVEGYNKLVEEQNALLARGQKLVREMASSKDLYNETYRDLERLSKPREELTALERTFGTSYLPNKISDIARSVDQGLAQGATIRENLNLAINGNNVTDEELDDFRRAVLASAEAGPSDEMREYQRSVEEKGGGFGTALMELVKTPDILPELVVSSVAMMANKEVIGSGLLGGIPGLLAGPGGFLTGAAITSATTLEGGLSFGEFMMEELANKQGVDINEVDMSNEAMREVLSDRDAMSRMRNRAAGRGVTMGLFNALTRGVASGVTRRVVGKTGSKLKGILAAGAVDAPLESAGEAIGRVAGRQEMTPLEIVLEGAAKGPGFVLGVGEGLIRSPKYTLNGEAVGGREMARFIREADEADVAGATIEIKNDKVLSGLANDKRNTARERQIIGKQLRESGITDDDKVQTLTDLELEKRRLKGNETTSGKKKAERIQREIDATLDGDSYFFEEETDEQGNTISKEVRVTRREAVDALKDDDIINPTEKEIEAKQAELFRDAMAEIGREDAIQEPSTEEVDVGEQPADGEEVGVGDTEEEVVAEEEEAVVDAEAEELAERLEAEGTPDVTEQVSDNVTAERKQGTTLGRKQQRIVEQAKKRAASLANSVSGLQVKLYETTDQYQKATNKTGKGAYLRDLDEDGNIINKTIHINLELANSRTVAHEAFHAIFLENLSDTETQAQAKALMSTIRKSVAGDSAMAKRIDQFLSAYNEAEIDEEALSEIFGYISNGYGELTAPEQSKVKAVIKALIERFTNLKLESGWSEGDQNVLDLFNTLAQKMEAGEEITAEEVGGLKVSEERVAEVEADTEIDTRIAAAQEKLAGANDAIGTMLGELSRLLDEVDDEAASNLLASVKKTISAKQVGATVKKIRDVKKSKRMSADDKAEALTKLEAKLDGQLEVLEKARDGVQENVDSAVERVKAKAEKQRAEAKKTERLAQIKDEGKAITKERSKAITKAKKEFEGEELKTAIELIEEETKAKRDALKAEKAELEKKKAEPTVEKKAEPTVEEEVTPEAEVTEVENRIAKEKENLETLKQKLAEAKRDLKEFEAREEKKRGKKERDNKKKAVADIESAIQESTKNIEELEAEVSSMIPTEVDTGTVRNRVGKEKYSAFETAVRDLLEYTDEVGEEPTRGQKNALTRRKTKVAKLVAELKLSPAEQAVVQSFVQERVNNKKEAEAKRKVEQEKNKAAAERAKKEDTLRTLNNKLVQATRELLKLEDVGATESMKTQAKSAIDAIKAEIDSLMADRPAKDESPVVDTEPTPKKKPKREYDPTVDKTTGRKLTDKELRQNEIVNKAFDRIKKLGRSKADITKRRYLGGLEAAVTRLNGLISAAERTGDKFLVEDLRSVRANVGRAMNEFLDKTEGMSSEQVEAMEARFESPYYEFLEALKTENPINAFEKTYVEALGKAGIVLYPSSSTAEASPVLKELIEASEEIDEINEKLDKLEASSTEAKALRKRQKELMRVASGEVASKPVKKKAPAKKALAKRAAVEGVSVEELTKEQQKVERQRKETFSRQAVKSVNDSKAEVKKLRVELKGKKGAERKPLRDAELRLKEAQTFLDNLKTKSVDEALRLRTPVPSVREQRVEDQRIAAQRFDLFLLREIGRGSSRVVYDLGDGRALKVALNAKGLEQNQTLGPWDVETNLKGFVPLVFEEGPDYLVVENVPQPEQWEGPNGLNVLSKFINGLEEVYPKGLGEIQAYLESYKEGMGSFADYEMLPGDFMRADSWGVREDGTIVLVDEGALNPRVYLGSEPEAWAVEDFFRIEEERFQYYAREQQPKAREQRVADVVERYDFRPNGSLRESSLADELRRNLKRYGFGVKQFGTRMDDFHIVNPTTGRKVDPKKLIEKDRADEKIENEQRAEVEEREAEKRMAIAEAEDLRSEELKRYQREYVDFPGDIIPPSTLSVREQRDSLNDELSDEDSTYSAVKFAKERGFSNAAILKFRPGSQQAIDAYEAKENRLKEEIKGVIVKATQRIRGDKDIQGMPTVKQRDAAALARLENDVLRYLQKSKFYQNASDVGREAMVRGVKKQLGINMKSAPSANRLLNGPVDKNGFSEQEKKGLRDQIRAMARSSKTTATAISEARKQIAKDVAKLRKDGVLTTAQATALLNRMARTNPLNEASVNSFIEYADKVFMDADYAKKMNDLNKMRKRALKYAEEKTGINIDVIDAIRTIAGINAEAIPEEVLKEYTEVITQLSERKAVLNLENRVSLRNKLETILDAIDQELNAKDELLAEFENFDDKVRDDSGKVSIAKTISAMVEAGVITKDEAKLLRKYQGELFPEPEGRDEAELQQERDNEKRFLLGVIEGLPELTHKFPTREENVLLGQFNELIKTSGIESLDNAELKNLLRVANNIENGFLPHMAEVLVEKIDAENKRAEVMAAVFNDKSGLARLYDSFLPGNLKRRAKRTPRKYIDQVWGNFRGTPLFDAVYKELAEGAAKYRSELETINARMSVREDKLFKALSRDPNAITRAKFLVSAYMMQKEFESSKGMPGVFSAVDLLDATINQKGRTQARYSEESKQVLRSIRDQIEGRTADEIESLIRDEKGGEQMMAVAKEIRDINDELTPKAQYTASVIRGVKFVPFSQYFHRIVLTQEGNQKKVFGDSSLRDVLSDRVALQPSTKAVNIQEREKGSPMAVSFDPFASVNRGAKNVLTDYHLTKPVRTNKRLLKKLQDVEVNTARQDNMLDIIIDGSTTAVEDLLIEIVNQSTMASKAFDFMRKQGYRNALGSPRRAVTELLSNAFYAVFVDHGSFLEGTKYRNIYTGSGAKIMRNTNSLQTTRLFPGLEGSGLVDRKGGTGGLNSMGLDQVSSSMSPTRAEIRNGALNLASRVLSQTAGRAYRLQADAADYMITTPDKVVSRPIWFGTFAREFESVTGKKPDMDKIADGDNQYLEQYRGAIETAKVKADDASIKAGATDNSVLGVEAASMRPDKGALQNMIAFVNNYMTRFLVFEYVTARTAVNAMVGNGMIRKRDGVRLLSGVFARAYSYQLIGRYLSDAIAALLYGDDDDLEEKDFLERSSLAVKQGAAGLVLGGTRGQATRGIRAMFLELGNRDFLMENPEEWDYDKRIGYPIIDINKESQLSNRLIKSGIRYTGPFSPVVGAGYQVLTEQVSPAVGLSKERKDKQRELEEDYRSMLLLISASGVLPLAPEIKSNVQRWMYKDIDKKKSKVIRVR